MSGRLRTRAHVEQAGLWRVPVAVMAFVIAAAGACSPSPASAEDWMFARSYFSHALPEGVVDDLPVPQSRSAYRRPYVGNRPGFSIRGGYRFNRVQLRSGNSFDTTVLRSDWFEVYP